MRYAIVGGGRMGAAIDRIAASRGHERTATLGAGELSAAALGDAQLAFEFTRPDAAGANVEALIRDGRSVVCGTTGWQAPTELDALCRAHEVGAVIAPNFSLGMQLFYRIAEHAAALFARVEGYEPYLHELHHRGKRDLPSGTALRLADRVSAKLGAGVAMGSAPNDGELHVSASRGGGEPGTHTLGFDGAHDLITMEHRARDRAIFAHGAVVAAEWIVGRTGRYDFDAVVASLLEPNDGGKG